MFFDFYGGRRRRTVTPGDKIYLLKMARGKCEYCGEDIIGKRIGPNVHHIVPKASGGSDNYHNLIVLCPNCHTRVDQISKAELRLKIAYRLPKKSSAESIPKKTASKKTTPRKTGARKSSSKK